MNKVILMGRLTRDPEIRYTQAGAPIANYTLAVDRPNRNTDGQTADFIRCVCLFPKASEFAEQYLSKGVKIVVTGRIQTGNYTNRESQKVYTTDVIVENQEFAESKRSSAPAPESNSSQFMDSYMNIPDMMDEGLPFN